ncbi:Ribonucleases P/MRP protein subunit pop3 [Schizosaccharomyces pombe]|uniref:Ribonucleases P/MRP protein subunit pop3 n=1 Tax=Schizosaccharomyces pombe (strain 972 / ATCC 24843) TaxID=284812 RepID=POP3_SCHPO|nr:putative Rnase P/MRP subunit [Schizosaccharomyces pombe]O74450.1 RecName: Full=Ribonucleases P/MRP protein subunit pop3; AltName: Full=RNA-processing protein pop3 [Schizosaccharomyces pombe 972h-]CAA20744.1 RNase P and RNase MRP subunit (predicted) [Schizosaccharomyces pombe]|eukprot:NP_587915.1 putative Rnase P/MRP subunit [Schizosaccharomyces pombe]
MKKKQTKVKQTVKLVLRNPLSISWPIVDANTQEKLAQTLVQWLPASHKDILDSKLTVGLNSVNELLERCCQNAKDVTQPAVVFILHDQDSMLVTHMPQLVANANFYGSSKCRLVPLGFSAQALIAKKLGLSRAGAIAVQDDSPLWKYLKDLVMNIEEPQARWLSENPEYEVTKVEKIITSQKENQGTKKEGKNEKGNEFKK